MNDIRQVALPAQAIGPNKRPLEPIERISEVLFGLIMVLSITCSFSVANAAREQVTTMLISALGCNLAWGIIDACMYLMACFSSRAENLRSFKQVRRSLTPVDAHHIIADALPPLVASVMSEEEFESLRQKLICLPEPPDRPSLHKEDWLGAIGVLLIVFLSTLPVVIPFAFMSDATRALRISNVVALAMLFLAGYALGESTNYRPWRMGLLMVMGGGMLVVITIALGG